MVMEPETPEPTPTTDDAVADEAAEEERDQRERPAFTVKDRRFWNVDGDEREADESERPKLPSFVEHLKQQLEQKDKQLKDYIAAYKSEVVEGLEKTKQRLERDAEARLERQRGQLAEPMLEVLEALERSLVAAESGADAEALLQGVKMVHMLMLQKLQVLGLARLEVVGHPFDPSLHEAVAVVPVTDPAQDNLVINEIRAGFKLGEQLVRAALVQVGKLQ
jgi:molecular chaperone GrpE